MKLDIDGCTIDIDEAATREYYSAHPEHNSCTCSGCENFRQCVPQLPEEVKTFFQSCGIDDMHVISEIIPLAMLDDGLLYYGGFFHLVGSMTNGKSITVEVPCYKSGKGKSAIKTGSSIRTHTESGVMTIGESFTVYFTDSIALLPDGFPEKVIQMEIEAHLPWVIDKENTYY